MTASFRALLIGTRGFTPQGVAGASWTGRALAVLREVGPYLALELILPGGTLVSFLYWLWRRRSQAAVGDSAA
jgi:hypothetical protein